jgi:orotidine-5'-phosphate decarboxylase
VIDKLINQITTLHAPIVVGLDTTVEMLPSYMLDASEKTEKTIAESLLAYNRTIIDAVYDLIPAVKPQIAMYERYGLPGLRAYVDTIDYAQSKGLIVIGDIKRGDIASTAAAYAYHIGGLDGSTTWQQDMVTLNPYLGHDSITPFLDVCAKRDKGIFILVKTSNPGSGDLQDLKLASGLTVYEHVADLVCEWGKSLIGKQGYSKVGAVVGATYPQQGAALRKRMPSTFFLVPGYGAQGGTGKDLKDFFDNEGLGCIVNSSRGIIAAWKQDAKYSEKNVGEAARQAVLAMKKDLTW